MTSKKCVACNGLWTGLLLLSLILRTVWSIQLVIEQGPESVVTFPGKVVTFTCSGRGTLYMTINGTSENRVSHALRMGMDLHIYPARVCTHRITFLAKEEYNNTLIQCVALDFGVGDIESDNATLMIQGLLGAVTDLHVVNSPDSIAVFWSAPFSLDVTGVDTDIWYSVLIYNVTDEENPTGVPCTDCHNLTQTHYIFSPDYPSPHHMYTFTVIPYNEVGQGENSTSIAAEFVVADMASTEQQTTILRASTEQPSTFLRDMGIGIAIGSGGTLCFACIILMVVIIGRRGKGCALMWNKQPMSELQQNGAYEVCSTLSKNIKDENQRYTSCADEYIKMDPVYEKI